MKKWIKGLTVIGFLSSLIFGGGIVSHATTTANFEKPTFAWGGGNNDTQLKEIRKILDIPDNNDYLEVKIEGADLDQYLNSSGNQTSGLFSSVLIKRTDNEGQNTVTILTPDKITEVTEKGYELPLLTAGVSNLDVQIATVGDQNGNGVNGRSALAGVYKALAVNGIEIDPDRAELAQREVNVVADITKNAGENKSDEETERLNANMTAALAEIKIALAEAKENQNGQLTAQQVEEIVNKIIDDRGLSNVLTDDDVSKLVSLAESYQNVSGVLDKESIEQYRVFANNTLKSIGEKASNLLNSDEAKGFFQRIGDFFTGIWDSITGIFK